ncbi:P-loop NTPase fold protein [Pseudomonas gingeri]
MATNGTIEAAQFLDYYLDDNVDAEYAVMLSAPWGAGKTHFIKKYLDERSNHIDEGHKPCYLYASLYGVTSTSAINDQFFAQMYPRFGSKITRVIGTAAAHWVDKIVGPNNSDTLMKDMLLKLEGKVLIIDDLERCAMKIADVMGFINTFVEHEGLKVIILANEADIPADQRDVYGLQKEKLVGKTIQVKSNAGEVLEKLIERLKSKPVKETVERERSALLGTFSASGKSNYRNLRAILAEYERIVVAIDGRLQEAPEAMKQLLLYMVATGNEFRSGSLTTEAFKAFPTSQFAAVRVFSSTKKSPAEQIFEQLSNRYPEIKWTDPIISPKHLTDLYSAGIINVEEINEGLGQHPEVVGHANIPAWRLLWDWTQLSKTEYLVARTELLSELAEYKIIHPGIIMHVAGISISLSGHGDQILGEGIETEPYFKEYISVLLERNTLVPNRGAFGFDGMAFLSLGYLSSNTPEFQSIYTLVKQGTEDVERRQLKKVAEKYVSRLTTDPDRYSSLFEYGIDDENYGAAAFLHFIDVADFARLLIIDSRSNDQLFYCLIKRYEHDCTRGSTLKDEYDWLESLKQHLLVMIDTEVAPFEAILRQRVQYYFGKIERSVGRFAVIE